MTELTTAQKSIINKLIDTVYTTDFQLWLDTNHLWPEYLNLIKAIPAQTNPIIEPETSQQPLNIHEKNVTETYDKPALNTKIESSKTPAFELFNATYQKQHQNTKQSFYTKHKKQILLFIITALTAFIFYLVFNAVK